MILFDALTTEYGLCLCILSLECFEVYSVSSIKRSFIVSSLHRLDLSSESVVKHRTI